MVKHSSILDINNELLLQRFKQGITLAKPLSRNESASNSVSNIFSLPISVFFVESNQQQFAKINEGCAELAGIESPADAINKSADDFSDQQLSLKVRANNNNVMNTERMIVTEECGTRIDDFLIQTLTFKFPWYSKNKIVGVFGIGIQTSHITISKMAEIMSQLISTGLLGTSQSLPKRLIPNRKNNDIYLVSPE